MVQVVSDVGLRSVIVGVDLYRAFASVLTEPM